MEELTPDELNAMEALSREKFDISALEANIINQLTIKGLVEKPQKSITMKKIIFQIAASVALLISGYFVGSTQIDSTSVNNDKSMYALFLYENDEFTVTDEQTLVAEYMNWAIDLGKKEKLVYAEKLNDFEKHWLGRPSVQNQTSQLSGYFVFYATDLSEAKIIAATHPHTSYGGGLELRSIDKIN